MTLIHVVQERPHPDGEITVVGGRIELALAFAEARRDATGLTYWVWNRQGDVVAVFGGRIAEEHTWGS